MRRSQNKNHHHHNHNQQHKHVKDELVTVTAMPVNHNHQPHTKKSRNKNHNKHFKKPHKHETWGQLKKSHDEEKNKFLLDDNNSNNNDGMDKFAETSKKNHNEEELERDREKSKFEFDLPNKDYIEFDKVMQNSDDVKFELNKEQQDDDDDTENEDDNDEVDDKIIQKHKISDQFSSISSDIFDGNAQIEEKRQHHQESAHKGSKLLENRHKINDEASGKNNKQKTTKSQHGHKTIKGDMSCMRDENFIPAPAIENADIKYFRNDIYGVENSFLEAEYHCHKGYKLVSLSLAAQENKEKAFSDSGSNREVLLVTNTTNLMCHNEEWIGNFIPKCVKIKGKNLDKLCMPDNKCEQMCFMRNHTSVEQCTCFKGFRMVDNACVDINECTENTNNCEHQCINTIGSYTCRCMPGFEFNGKHKCQDINECTQYGNTKGPCQDKCINLPGTYKCTCDNIPGTQLSTDGHSCVVISSTSTNNIAISEQTLSSSATVISVCPRGYYFNYTNDECEDFDECSVNNGGCKDICTNTDGSFYCSCQSGYIFGPDNKTCVVNNITSDITCPPLIPPKHGYLECSRPLDESRHHIANFPGSQCVLRCPNGFRVMGRYSQICGNDGQWQGSDDGACIRYPKPKLTCPKNMVLETPPNDTRVVMPLPRPTTDVSWTNDITISPNYVKDLNLVLSSGIENITYIATHPISRLRVSCQFSINVLDGMPPVVKFCPETQHYTVAKHHETIKVSWIEPIFEDNIKVTSISKSNEPGNQLGLGTHLITYEAKDAVGFTSRCTFKIVINAPKRQILPLLYSKFYYL
uniref:CSON011141 protein n=1 Tax=Culicoides sonorensis TaxID=179676 RepID=A0A336M2Z5_CULSO